ncbi:MAG: FecR domain-containing protein [Leptospiraceae bacterium]|nr:FecR domain-containing protein [Leptospiraceae bacterium]
MHNLSIFKPTKNDIVVTIICFLILVYAFYLLFYVGSNQNGRGKKEVGKITFKYRIAQRKYVSRMIWEDVEQNTSAYNNDSIRTDFLSEATVTLLDGTKIELDPDSMFVLNVKDEKVNIKVVKGSVLVDTENNNKENSNIQIEQDGSIITPNNGKFRITQSKNKVEVVAHRGQIDIRKGVQKIKLKEGEVSYIDSKGFKNYKMNYLLVSPEDNKRIFTGNENAMVHFIWQEIKDTTPIQFEIAKDRDFNDTVFSKQLPNNQIDVNLTEGVFFWRITSTQYAELQEKSLVRKIHVIKNQKIEIISPENENEIQVVSGKIPVYFAWKKLEISASYTITVAQDMDFKNIVQNVKIYKNFISLGFEEGTYYWKIVAEGTIQGALSTSNVYRFKITKNNLVSIQLLYPEPSAKVFYANMERTGLLFNWKSDFGNFENQFILSKDASFRDIIEQSKQKENYVSFKKKLPKGDYYWKVISKELTQNKSYESEIRMFSVTETPERQEQSVIEKEETKIEKAGLLPKEEIANTDTQTRTMEGSNKEEDSIKLIFPENKSIVDMQNMNSLPFRWKDTNENHKYILKLYKNTDKDRELVFEREVENVEYDFKELQELDEGTFSYSVETIDNQRKEIASANFKIILSKKLDIPKVIYKIQKKSSQP